MKEKKKIILTPTKKFILIIGGYNSLKIFIGITLLLFTKILNI